VFKVIKWRENPLTRKRHQRPDKSNPLLDLLSFFHATDKQHTLLPTNRIKPNQTKPNRPNDEQPPWIQPRTVPTTGTRLRASPATTRTRLCSTRAGFRSAAPAARTRFCPSASWTRIRPSCAHGSWTRFRSSSSRWWWRFCSSPSWWWKSAADAAFEFSHGRYEF